MLGIILDALKTIFNLFLPFIIIIVIIVICKMIYRRYKYGYGCLDVIKKRKIDLDVDDELMELTLAQLRGEYEVIKTDKYYADFIVVATTGVYFIEMCNAHRGNISGDLKKEKIEWYDDGKFHYLVNPFIRQSKDLTKFKRNFPHIKTTGFVVFGNDVLLDFTYRGKSKIIRNRNLAYKLQELLNEQTPHYSTQTLKKIKLYLK